jgi:hypothetical protein
VYAGGSVLRRGRGVSCTPSADARDRPLVDRQDADGRHLVALTIVIALGARAGAEQSDGLQLILERPSGGAQLGGKLVAKRFRLRGLGRVTVAMSLLGGPVVRLHLGGHALGISPESLVRGLL